MNDQEKRERYEALEARRAEESERFWDRKARLSYYTVSLPIAIFGVAIASYPYTNGAVYSAMFEIMAWVLLLISGGAGIIAKWGEAEQSRQSSIIASAEIQRYMQHGDKFTPEYSKAVLNKQERLFEAEGWESHGTKWHLILLSKLITSETCHLYSP